jgi:hypothetical protein
VLGTMSPRMCTVCARDVIGGGVVESMGSVGRTGPAVAGALLLAACTGGGGGGNADVVGQTENAVPKP